MAPHKTDPDRADESAAPTNAPVEASERQSAAREPAKRAPARHVNARNVGGVWYAADGSPLTDKEAQQAHRARDAAAAEARRKAMLGGGE